MTMSGWWRMAPLLALTACGASGGPSRAVVAPSGSPAAVTDGKLEVGGGLSLHIRCVGEGTPVVVLDSGLGDDASVWADVQPEMARFTRVCAYDRAGTGSSSPAPRPHSGRQMVAELHSLLELAGVQGPYVLVGHSLGGLNVRLFASEHLPEVAGMVLVDAATEEQDTRCWGFIPEEAMRGFKAMLAEHPEGLDYEHFVGTMADVHHSKRTFGDVPLVVLTHGVDGPAPPGASAEVVARIEQAWRETQAELPSLSTNSVQITAKNAGHYIHRDAPQLVITAVREVVKAAREHGRVDAKPLSALADEGSP